MNNQVAYFSAEFGIHESLPVYSGGLGVLAGDYVKAANDLDIPVVGVGILYRKGYFQQRILSDGTQETHYPDLNIHEIPTIVELDSEGRPLLVEVPIQGRVVYLKIWRTMAGHVPVYLLDADIDENHPADRHLTDRLYGGDQNERICHEIILGIGGVRALRKLGMQPAVWHLNEGHAAFSTLERIREYSALGVPFDIGLEAVKASTLFTTHTPVPAGHDVFPFTLIDKYLGDYYWQLGAHRDEILGLGRVGDQFNMTRLAVSTSAMVNAVSKLHKEVTKELFHAWTPLIPAQDVPVESVTNGVHTDTWLAPELGELFQRHLPENWSHNVSDVTVWEGIEAIPDVELWDAHQRAKRRMIANLGLPFGEDVLVVGFARRFATYKRATLLLRDLERLMRIVNDTQRPVCFVFAGKAHPNDIQGQELICRIVEVSQMDAFRDRICIVENYDLRIAKHLVQGVDVWLNTPVKPMEASGTSGQKAALNGVLNCSVLDGWWCEGYNGQNGWAIDGAQNVDVQQRDDVDSQVLYWLLEAEIGPLFYTRTEDGVPASWVGMMKEAIRSLAPIFSASRMVTEYWERFYTPICERGARFTQNAYEIAKRVADYKRFIRNEWPQVCIESVDMCPLQSGSSSNDGLLIQAVIQLGAIWERDVRVEAVGSDGFGGIWVERFERTDDLGHGKHLYCAVIPQTVETWRQTNANIRVYPVGQDCANAFELELVTWGEKTFRPF